jgi:hypothetical protein
VRPGLRAPVLIVLVLILIAFLHAIERIGPAQRSLARLTF